MLKQIKKTTLMFIVLNSILLQTLVADMLFYYQTAILSSIMSSKDSSPKFTKEMLAGKTFYEYILDGDGTRGANRNQWQINADATKVTLLSIDGSETYISDLDFLILKDGSMGFEIPAGWDAVGIEGFRLIAVQGDDFIASSLKFDFYPRLLSHEVLADDGYALLSQYFSNYPLTQNLLTSHPWYSFRIGTEDSGYDRSYNYYCGSKSTFLADGSVSMEYAQDGVLGSVSSTYTVNNAQVEYADSTTDPLTVMATADKIFFTNQNALFETRDQVKAVMESHGLIAQKCLQYYPEDHEEITLTQMLQTGTMWIEEKTNSEDKPNYCYEVTDSGMNIYAAKDNNDPDSDSSSVIQKGNYFIYQYNLTKEISDNIMKNKFGDEYVTGEKTFTDITKNQASVHLVWPSDEDDRIWYKADNCLNLIVPDSNNGDDEKIDYTIDDGIADTKIVFKDGETVLDIPADAWVRISPKSLTDAGNMNARIFCQVQSDGSFENNCFIYSEEKSNLDTALADSSERYQVVVFKNHVEPDDKSWEACEDTYKNMGSEEANWSNIIVNPENYQDNSTDCQE